MPTKYENFSLLPYNTFQMNVFARQAIEIHSEKDITESIHNQLFNSQNCFVLGGGSNLLFTKNYDGCVLINKIQGLEIVQETAKDLLVRVGGGVVWHEFVLYCIAQNWGGAENLSLIPGTVGASPIQNIGAYGVELKDIFHSLDAIHLETAEKKNFSLAECKFGYRESIFKNELRNQYFITNVYFNLQKEPTLNISYGDIKTELAKLGDLVYTIKEVSDAVIAIRTSKLPDPREIGNCGSFFKNPTIPLAQYENLKLKYPEMPHYPAGENKVKVPAAWLIQQCGWKGKRFGNYGVHERQALVLVNYGGANGNDIFQLSVDIMESIFLTFGINLEREVNVR